MLLDKLESGFLRFETPQGLAAAEPTFWQRVYLLWTFRNFHQLSPLLLNPRQTALINDLFRQQAVMGPGPQEYEPRLEIGIVENFAPPAIEIDTMPAAITDALRTMKTKLPEPAVGQGVASRVIPIAASPAMMVDGPPAAPGEKAKKEGAGIDCVEIAPKNVLDRSFGPMVFWLRSALSNPRAFRLVASRPVTWRFAAAIGALSLCVYFAIVWHRIEPAPGSQTHNSVAQLNSPPASPSAPTPAPDAVNLPTAPELPTEAIPDQEAPLTPSPAEVGSSITITHQIMTRERESRVPAARVARSRGASHPAAFSKSGKASRSTHRITLAHGYRGARSSSAKVYFDLADQQLHKGNYAAAAANYKRAWRIEGRIAAAKGRLVRARLTMQAEKQSTANQR